MTDSSDKLSWKRMSFKGNKVWAETDPNGSIKVMEGKVRIRYNLDQDYEYRIKEENLRPEQEAVPAGTKKPGKTQKEVSPRKKISKSQEPVIDEIDIPDNCIRIYTDGASSGNPGPSGIGALLLYGENRKEISRNIGISTNNIAELTAIEAALSLLKRGDLPVRLYTDSSYALGLLTQGWKPQKNKDLVARIKKLMERFDDLKFIKVKGHSGIKENEIADFLATSAIERNE